MLPFVALLFFDIENLNVLACDSSGVARAAIMLVALKSSIQIISE
jgi:hypothetical protein